MTVTTTNFFSTFNGSGTTGPFTWTWQFYDNDFVIVVKEDSGGTETTLTEVTDYTLTGAGSITGGSLTLTVALASGEKLYCYRDTDRTQEVDLLAGGAYLAEVVEDGLDKLTQITQEIDRKVTRSFRLTDTDTSGASTDLPSPQAATVIGWDSNGLALANYNTIDLTTVAAYGSRVTTTFLGDAATVDFTLPSTPGSLNNLLVSIDGVTQFPTRDYTWDGNLTITFTAAPPAPLVAAQDNILVSYHIALPNGIAESDDIITAQTGANAITRVLADKINEVVSVTDYGADKTGATDSTTAILAAIASITSGTVFFPAGTYLVSGTILIDKPSITLAGEGYGKTIIKRATGGTDPDYGPTFEFEGDDDTDPAHPQRLLDVGLRDMRIQNLGTVITSPHVRMSGVRRAIIQNIHIEDGYIGFSFETSGSLFMDSVYIRFDSDIYSPAGAGSRYVVFTESATYTDSHPSCGDIMISNFNFRGGTLYLAEHGVHITSADGIWFSNGHIGNSTTANVYLDHASSTEPLNLVFFDNVMFDIATGTGVTFTGAVTDTSQARDIAFSNCTFSGGAVGTNGIRFVAGTDFEGVYFTGCSVVDYTESGVSLASTATRSVMFSNCNLHGNSYNNSNAYNNYTIADGVTSVSIIGGVAGGPAVTESDGPLRETTFTKYGISIGPTSDRIVISGVDLTDNLTGGMNIGPTANNVSITGCINETSDRKVASATTVTLLPWSSNFAIISGTTNIENIQAVGAGVVVALVFEGILTVVDGGNLKLAGNFTTSANDTLMLVCDGTYWYEISRSAN